MVSWGERYLPPKGDEVAVLAVDGARPTVEELERTLQRFGFSVQREEKSVTDALLALIERPEQHALLLFRARSKSRNSL